MAYCRPPSGDTVVVRMCHSRQAVDAFNHVRQNNISGAGLLSGNEVVIPFWWFSLTLCAASGLPVGQGQTKLSENLLLPPILEVSNSVLMNVSNSGQAVDAFDHIHH